MQKVTGSTPVISTKPDFTSGFFIFINFQQPFNALQRSHFFSVITRIAVDDGDSLYVVSPDNFPGRMRNIELFAARGATFPRRWIDRQSPDFISFF